MSAPAPRLTPAGIAAAGRTLPPRFVCELRVAPRPGAALDTGFDPVEVECRRVLRLLPGRRLVAVVRVAGRDAVLKLFMGPGAGRYRRRETAGCEQLLAAGVNAPALLAEVAPADGGTDAGGLLFEYLAHTQPLDQRDLTGVCAAAAELGRLHRGGALHTDLHLDNFLVARDGAVFAVDGDGVRRVGGLGRRRSLDNLAVLCAQREPLLDAELPSVLGAYATARGWTGSDARMGKLGGALARATRRKRRQRVRRYLGKAQRDCSEYYCRQGLRSYFVCLRDWHDTLGGFAEDPESAFRDAEVLKAGNTATVVRARLGGRPCIVKRYNRRTWWQALRWAVKPLPRYRRAWLNGQRLYFLGIATARPLALLEQRFGPFKGKGYLVMEDLGGTDLAQEVARDGLGDNRLIQVVTLFRALAAAGLVHGDTKASNFLVGEHAISVVDLDAMREAESGQDRDRRRFLANFGADPAVQARLDTAFAAAGLSTGDG